MKKQINKKKIQKIKIKLKKFLTEENIFVEIYS